MSLKKKILPPPTSGGGGEKFSLGTLQKYGIRIKSTHDTGTEGQYQPRNCSRQNRVYPNMIDVRKLCIDAGGNHFQHLLRWYIL